ncbi:hypothetical protein NSERUTF1_2655 [Nocardia seriolae]|nr:hypothetical protein NSERUTF1_2655 [Nocardia seriolae]
MQHRVHVDAPARQSRAQFGSSGSTSAQIDAGELDAACHSAVQSLSVLIRWVRGAAETARDQLPAYRVAASALLRGRGRALDCRA